MKTATGYIDQHARSLQLRLWVKFSIFASS